mgnify:CR=1 FL=1
MVYYNDGINIDEDKIASICTDDISTEGFREWSLTVLPSNVPEKKLAIPKAPQYDTDWYRQYNLYYYGLAGVGIEVDGRNIDLSAAINQGMITMSAILAKCNRDVLNGIIEELSYDDGGSSVYRYPDYTIVKYHTLDGNDDMYIGTTDMDIHIAYR